VVLLKPDDMQTYEFSNPRVTKLACPYKEFTFAEQLGFKGQLDSLKPDLVHFGMAQQPVLYRGKAVTTIHDLTTIRFANPAKNPLVYRAKQRIYAYVIRRAAKKSAAVITPTEFVKKDVAAFAGISEDKVTVTYEAADPITEPAEPLPALADKRLLLYVGRPTPHKNLERLVQAHQQIMKWQPELLLVLAGKKDANYQRIEADAQTRGLRNVVFTGFISEGQLRWLYEHCAAYVFPSLSEGFGLPGLEAMVHGAPVVSSSATCLPEVYGDAAHYFDPTDVPEMVRAINEVLTDETLREKLIANGYRRSAAYSWQRTAEQTLEVYRQTLSQN
jgi:glycosyltransferase involved in cell wall biosynthesis